MKNILKLIRINDSDTIKLIAFFMGVSIGIIIGTTI
jgi:hypothetical protein